ncbi:MAG: ClpXP protease specificity-enhancing factor SspB [Rhodospirillales bacterium]
MNDDPLRYDTWIEDALRSVIRRTLGFAAENGLPGEHHFYITFRTDADGVEVPAYLKAENPEELTIVLQHQFEDLVVNEDAMWVTLRFNGSPERLRIPFDAVLSFADPSVNFGLQLKMSGEPEGNMEFDATQAQNFEAEAATPAQDANMSPGNKKAKGTGEVIALDAFRKK